MEKLVYSCLVLVMLVTLACTGAAPPTSTPPVPGATQKVAVPVQSELEKLIAAAQKEGLVDVAATGIGAAKAAMSQAFKTKYGIDVQYVDGISAEIVPKVLAERRAGLYVRDVGHIGDSTYFVDIGPNNITVPLRPLLFFPEVVDGSKWRGGALPTIDKDGHILSFVAMTIWPIIINTEMVDRNEMTKNADLLNPKWKGKIIMADPSVAGTANNWFTYFVTQTSKTREEGLQFMRALAKQEPLITRDNRLQIEWVARGKNPVAVGINIPVFNEFKKAGAPIEYAGKSDRTFFSPGAGNLIVFDKAPHPNATKLYVNFLLSKEGAELWGPGHGYPSMRLDVDNKWMDPTLVPRSEDIVLKREEYINLQREMRPVAREIFQEFLK